MSEVVEIRFRRASDGYHFTHVGRLWVYYPEGTDHKIELRVPLASMFKPRRRPERQNRIIEGRPYWRAMIENPATSLTEEAQYGPPEVQALPDDLYKDFLRLPQAINRSADGGETEVLKLANRYGLLHGYRGDRHPLEQHFETVAHWRAKSDEMHDATKRRDVNRLEPKHYRQIDAYIGALQPVSSRNGAAGGVRIAYQPTSLFGALWLQWARAVIPYQGECAVCGGPNIGRRGMKTCGDYCRKILSLEKQR